MSNSDQTIILSRKTILLVMAIGIGLLTLSYLLGVQAGKQGIDTKQNKNGDVEESLQKLPASIHDQIKAIEGQVDKDASDVYKPDQSASTDDVARPVVDNKLDNSPKGSLSVVPKQNLKEASEAVIHKKPENNITWVIQLISTPDLAEAQRMANKAQAAGFYALVISDKGLFKVRLTKVGNKELIDAIMVKLKSKGFKPFVTKK